MRARRVAIAAMTAMLLARAAGARTQDATAAFAGHWRATGVAVPDEGVQALADDDKRLMGKRLTFSQVLLAWNGPTPTHGTCLDPRITRLERPAGSAVRCGAGRWGPGDSPLIFRDAAGTLAMPWYDGGVLKLSEQ